VPGINHPDQQPGQEHEALGVLDVAQFAVIQLHEPVAALERQVVQHHEDEEVAPHTVQGFEAPHRLLPSSLR
jgi:hypothetical protein